MCRIIFFLISMFAAGFAENFYLDERVISSPQETASLTLSADDLVCGLINPLGGQPVLREIDLESRSAVPLTLYRDYLAPFIPSYFGEELSERQKRDRCFELKDKYNGWQFFPHLRLDFDPVQKSVRCADPGGAVLEFSVKRGKAELTRYPYGIHNALGGIPNGHHDLRNTRIEVEERRILLHAPDGTEREYLPTKFHSRSGSIYYLEKERLPSGSIIKYEYNERGSLEKVSSWDPKEHYCYGMLLLKCSGIGKQEWQSETGLSANYNYETRIGQWKFSEKLKKGKHKENWRMPLPPLLKASSTPFFCEGSSSYSELFLLTEHTGKKERFNLQYVADGANGVYRVSKLLLPIEEGYETAASFTYEPPIPGERGGSTTVLHQNSSKTVYVFSKELLLTKVEEFDHEGNLRKIRLQEWDEKHRLTSLSLLDGEQNILYRKSYEYDSLDNPVLEKLEGVLSGEGGIESFTIRREYSQDHLRLLLVEEEETGKTTRYTYLPGTDLLASKIISAGREILQSEYYSYNDSHHLIEKVHQEGSSRLITRYRLREQQPFLHRPEWIEKSFSSREGERLLEKKHLDYDKWGNVEKEEVYDADSIFRYALFFTYNERGDLLSETNPHGLFAVYTYDAHGRKIYQKSFSGRLTTHYTYDIRGRLIETSELGEEGVQHRTAYSYLPLKSQTIKRDYLGNTTIRTNDPITHKAARIDYPCISSLEEMPIPVVTTSSYDCLGNEISYTDANGMTTRTAYNAYGKPIEILHPDGARESFRYHLNGQPSRYTDPDGLTTLYEYDLLGRLTAKEYISSSQAEIGTEYFTYDGTRLASHTNLEGIETRYFYDGAGRKIREEKAENVLEFYYGPLGYVSLRIHHNGAATLYVHTQRDLEGRIIEERCTDANAEILTSIGYSYDSNGNLLSIIRKAENEEAIERFFHDSFGREILRQDPLSNATHVSYEERDLFKKVTTNPLGVQQIESFDALGRLVNVEKTDANGKTIAAEQFFYDPVGNLILEITHLYREGEWFTEQRIAHTYTPRGKRASTTRGYGSSLERITSYSYTPAGKLESKTLPDGNLLHYSYHPLGHLYRVDSSDGTIHHQFAHNLVGDLLAAYDENREVGFQRRVDPSGNILEEKFSTGLFIAKEYDTLNRPKRVRLHDLGELRYDYDPLHLKRITRLSNEGELLYSHSFSRYDQGGHLIEEELIGSLGRVFYTTDPVGRLTSSTSPYFSQEYVYNSCNNLVRARINGSEFNYRYDILSQLIRETRQGKALSYLCDSLHNCREQHDPNSGYNALCQLAERSYDQNGNQTDLVHEGIKFHLSYDLLNRLVKAESDDTLVEFSYDPLGRCLSKQVVQQGALTKIEDYLYDGNHEIAAFSSGKAKNLRILAGLDKAIPRAIAIEAEGFIFAPLHDAQGTILELIQLGTNERIDLPSLSAFGEPLDDQPSWLPWQYVSKRLHPEIGCIDFGRRYYAPCQGLYLSPDPTDALHSSNLYQYVDHNPLRYADPDGRFAIASPCSFGVQK